MIPATESRGLVRRSKEGIDFMFFEVTNRNTRRSLEPYLMELSAPFKTLWASLSDEAGQRMYGRQPLVACRNAATALFFDVPQKDAEHISVDVFDEKSIRLFMQFGGCEDDQQAHCIAVAFLGIAR